MAKKTRRLDINYKLLQTSGNIEVVGSVPNTQIYQADKAEYTPDYALTPLTLFPRCNATDPEAITKVGEVNSKLTNMSWYERIGGVRKQITSSNAYYTIVESGDRKGQITVRKNISTINPVTLEFYAEYADIRTGQVFSFTPSALIHSVDGTEAIPVLMIDSPSTLDWNPVRDINQQTITAKLMVGDQDVTASAKCKLFWYRVLGTGALELITTGAGDNDWEFVSLTKSTYVIDRNYIGDDITIVCKATYDAGGNPASVPASGDPMITTSIRRRIPKIEADWQGVPTGLPDGTAYIYPRPIVTDTMGTIQNASDYFSSKWSAKKKSASNYTQVATGYTPKIEFTADMMLELDVDDYGPYCYITVGNKGLTVNGKILVVRSN